MTIKDEMEKTYKQFDIALKVYEKVYDLAVKFVDDKTTYGEMINLTTIASDKVEAMKCREEAISVVLANILGLSESVRL